MSDATGPRPLDDPTLNPEWMNGYRAALDDALEMVDALGGPSFANLSAPVLLRMKARLIEMQGRSRVA